jgi:signal transduction histidine kinase
LLVLAVRYAVLTRLPNMTDWSLDARINIAVLLSAINGVTHASSLAFFPMLTDIERTIQSLILAGLCIAAVATTAGHRRVFVAYFLPIFPTLVVLWATKGSWSVPDRTDVILALAIALFAFVLLINSRDTERQFVETIRIRKEQEELNKQLQAALQAAGVADRAKTRFLASASHDLRQPIHALSLFGAALKMQELPVNVRDLAENIDESITVLASQLDALLDISRLDAGVVTPDIGTVDLSSMLRRIARELELQVSDKGLSLSLYVADDCQVVSDKLLLERVIRNLLNNAIRYTESGGISIETLISGETCRLVIADTGIGIAEAEQEKIFSEFYQVSQRYGESKQGLGLGLSIVARLLRLLDAPLSLSSMPGEGTRIEISLKLEHSRKEDMDAGEMLRLDGIRILVLDDDSAVRKAMTTLLASFGAHVSTAGNVDEALALVGNEEPDLLLSDLRLGVETGLDAVARMRETGYDTPTILITGDTSSEQIRLAHESGLELLHKPVNTADLERKIAEVLKKN